MKYAVFYKKFDELDGDDFDKEVLNQYENLTLKKEGLSYTVNGQEVITTIDDLMQDMCEKQIELIFDSLIERIEVLEQTSKRGKWLPIIEVNEFGESYQSGIYCSECGETLGCEANYCPNCGADMRGDEE